MITVEDATTIAGGVLGFCSYHLFLKVDKASVISAVYRARFMAKQRREPWIYRDGFTEFAYHAFMAEFRDDWQEAVRLWSIAATVATYYGWSKRASHALGRIGRNRAMLNSIGTEIKHDSQ